MVSVKAGKLTERQIQNEILNLLNLKGVFAWHVKNGATYDRRLGVYRSNTSVKGVPDIVGVTPTGRFLAIEVKTKTGRVSKEQKAFIERIESQGGIAFVARDIQDVIDRLEIILTTL